MLSPTKRSDDTLATWSNTVHRARQRKETCSSCTIRTLTLLGGLAQHPLLSLETHSLSAFRFLDLGITRPKVLMKAPNYDQARRMISSYIHTELVFNLANLLFFLFWEMSLDYIGMDTLGRIHIIQTLYDSSFFAFHMQSIGVTVRIWSLEKDA